MTALIDDFHKLEQRICLSGFLKARTALRIGSGGSGELDAVDLPVLRDRQGYPLIPGSSLKGVLRSTIEALIRGSTLNSETGVWTCDPLTEGKAGGPKACGYHEKGNRARVNTDEHCAVCRLFGSHVIASHVRFSDALIPTEDRNGRAPVEIRDGVAIDRDRRIAADKKLYNFEVIAPGTRFALEVFVENPQPWLMGLLVIGFEQIAEGFSALGGFTSRGLGRMEVHWSEMRQSTARELLNGQSPVKLDEQAMQVKFAEWREALARQSGSRGDCHV